MVYSSLELLRHTPATPDFRLAERIEHDDQEFAGIRCPLCGWRPTPESIWSCLWTPDAPEPRFASCGATWNTFASGGVCPECAHQWRWTSCLQCARWSPHDEWYESD
jgi:hypothetical protein